MGLPFFHMVPKRSYGIGCSIHAELLCTQVRLNFMLVCQVHSLVALHFRHKCLHFRIRYLFPLVWTLLASSTFFVMPKMIFAEKIVEVFTISLARSPDKILSVGTIWTKVFLKWGITLPLSSFSHLRWNPGFGTDVELKNKQIKNITYLI